MTMMNDPVPRHLVSDDFALPRVPETAIHGLVGEWEYKTVSAEELLQALQEGWTAVETRITVKYVHWERCGCGKEAHHDTGSV